MYLYCELDSLYKEIRRMNSDISINYVLSLSESFVQIFDSEHFHRALFLLFVTVVTPFEVADAGCPPPSFTPPSCLLFKIPQSNDYPFLKGDP